MVDHWRKAQFLITVRAHPEPSEKYVETSCVAAVDLEANAPVRLYPVEARKTSLRKGSIIEAKVRRSNDPRTESYNIDRDSIKEIRHIDTSIAGWAERNELTECFRVRSNMEELWLSWQKEQTKAPSLCLIRPAQVIDVIIEKKANEDWTPDERAKLARRTLFDSDSSDITPLEWVGYKLKYHFLCDNSDCKGHKMECLDWEASEPLRKWPKQYPNAWKDKVRQKFITELGARDLQFYVGTLRTRPWQWSIIGLHYPPKGSLSRNLPLGLDM